jgi:phage tail sheath protein FI
VSRAAQIGGGTPQITITSNTNGTNSTGSDYSNVFYCNTSALEVGMILTQITNSTSYACTAAVNITNASGINYAPAPTIVSLNATAIVLSVRASVNIGVNSVAYFARPDTAYSALAVDTATAQTGTVANLSAHTVKNLNDYITKDGTFDTDVSFIARYPGAIGNSLRVSVCSSVNSFSSNIGIQTTTFNDGTLSVKTNANSTVNGFSNTTDTLIISNANSYITVGDRIYYSVATGNTAIGGLTGNTYYYVTFVNSSALAISTTSGGSNVDITSANITSTELHSLTLPDRTSNSFMYVSVGSNASYINFLGTTNAGANATAALFSLNDLILVGNTTIGSQYLQVTGKTITSLTAAVSGIDANGGVNAISNFITCNNAYTNGSLILNNGTPVVYANAAGNTAIGGLTNGLTYYVMLANTTGFKVSGTFSANSAQALTPGSTQTGHSFTANSNVLTINFQDPYRLRSDYVSNTVQRYWEFVNVIGAAPGQSDYQRLYGNTSANDEIHVVVVDNDGFFSGTPGTVLETYKSLSRGTDVKSNDNTNLYYKTVINDNSNYIWWANDRSVAPSNTAVNLISSSATAPANFNMVFGADGQSESNTNLSVIGAGYDLFASKEDVDISLVLQGKPLGGTTVVGGETINNFQLANYIIDNICSTRQDCIALISPDKAKVLNNTGLEATGVKNWRGALHSTSYAILDSGYKYQYDRYNDLYRWVPLNGDIGGLCVRTDNSNDAWWSPAGFNRGQIKNIIKLAWNPRQAERDLIYANGVNPVVTFPGQGTILYGDKTLTSKPSAFDRINVRRLFIVLEKAISQAAKYSLFEFNDAFTRAQFKNLVTPYLRNIQGRRGITDFLVVCDDTNNTPSVIDANQFVGDIYVKPARSITFIQLNFVAVGSGVQFSDVVGNF